MVISRRRFAENLKEMQGIKKKAREGRAKFLFLSIKYANLLLILNSLIGSLRTFALIVCAQPFCAGNATAICHASLRLTGPEDKHGVENTREKISGRIYSLGSSVTPIFLIMNHLLYLLSTKYDKMKKISP